MNPITNTPTGEMIILSQSEVNEIAHSLEIMAEVGVFEVVGSAEMVHLQEPLEVGRI